MTEESHTQDTSAEATAFSTSAEPPQPHRSLPRPERRALVPLWVYAVVGALVVLLAFGIGISLAVNRSVTTSVPKVTGLDSDVARTRLISAGFKYSAGDRRFSTKPANTVLEQDPAAGSNARKGATVSVVVSAGTEEFTMPDIIGNGIVLARGTLEARGLEVKVNSAASNRPRDTVLSTNPSPGATVHTGDIVILTVAASETLNSEIVPYHLNGLRFVVDPSKPTGGMDVPLDVSRRLRSLIEASGATVIATRGLADTNSTFASRVARAKDPAAVAIVGLDVASSGKGGFSLVKPAGLAGARASGTNTLAKSLVAALTLQRSTPAVRTVAPDALVKATSAPVVRVGLGSFTNRDDVASFNDPTWADQVARTIYRALGETYGTP